MPPASVELTKDPSLQCFVICAQRSNATAYVKVCPIRIVSIPCAGFGKSSGRRPGAAPLRTFRGRRRWNFLLGRRHVRSWDRRGTNFANGWRRRCSSGCYGLLSLSVSAHDFLFFIGANRLPVRLCRRQPRCRLCVVRGQDLMRLGTPALACLRRVAAGPPTLSELVCVITIVPGLPKLASRALRREGKNMWPRAVTFLARVHLIVHWKMFLTTWAQTSCCRRGLGVTHWLLGLGPYAERRRWCGAPGLNLS